MIELRDWLRSVGLECNSSVVADGRIHRFAINGSRRRNGWYWFTTRGKEVFGRAGDWKSGLTATLGSKEVHRKYVDQTAEQNAERAERAALKARIEWEGLPKEGLSLYLVRKCVPAIGLRFGRRFVAVPMSRDGWLVGIQKIFDDGFKLFQPRGCNVRAASYTITTAVTDTVQVICEGYATGASIYMATGLPVTLAFSCGNLLAVAKRVRAAHPGARIIVAADNDWRTEGNPGVAAAKAAASAVGGVVIVPGGIQGTDWNDMMLERGADFVAHGVCGAI